MGVTNRLVFDPTDANSIAASSSVGAYLRAGTDGDLISSGAGSADNVANTFEGIDSRSFLFGYDSVGDNWDRLQLTSGSLKVIGEGIFDEDSAAGDGDKGNHNLMVIQDTLASSVSADGDYGSMKGTLKGELYVHDADSVALLTTIDSDTGLILADTNSMVSLLTTIDADTSSIATDASTIAGDTTSIDAILTALSKAEDSVHGSGDQGIMALAVRNDAGTALAADGDYIPFSMDANGALRVNVVSEDDDDLADTAIENTATAVSLIAVNIVTSALANRKWLYLGNEGNKSLYFGKSGVTAANGFPLHPGQQSEFRIGPSVAPQIIGGTGASSEDLRVMELS